MAFQSSFADAVKRVSEKIATDVDLRKVLEQYDGRTITVDIKGDSIYVIRIFKDRVELATAPDSYDGDMYIQTDLDTARQLFRDHKIDPLRLMKIKTRRIGLNEINIARKLFG